ncbi:unnamed protein product [Prunus armeniaca]
MDFPGMAMPILVEHGILYLVHPFGAGLGTSTPDKRGLPCLKGQQNIGLRFLLGLLPVTQVGLGVSMLDSNVAPSADEAQLEIDTNVEIGRALIYPRHGEAC